METVRHTPGPWELGDINTDPNEGVLGEIAIIAHSKDSRHGIFCPAVALPYSSGASRNGEIMDGKKIALANAHLIAAAPEMLDALYTALRELGAHPNNPENLTQQELRDVIVGAIMKAEGKGNG